MVEWKKLSEICDIFAGGDLPKNYIKASEPSGKYIYPIYSNGVEEKSLYGYSDTFRVDKASITISARGTIGYHTIREPQFTPIVRLITLIPKNNEIVNLEYLNEALFLTQIDGTQGGIPQLTVPAVSQIKIPILSLSEQQRIVDILDTFTSSIKNLKEQIAQRRKQYEYYRDQLLDLEGKPGVEWFELLELCDYVDYRGKTPSKVDAGIFLVTAKNIRKGYIDYDNSKEYISEDDYEEVMHRGKPQIGDVLVTTEAPLGNVAQIDNENIALAQRVIKYRPKDERLNSSYLKYILLGSEFQIRLEKEATGATAKGIKGSKLHRMHIPLPPLSEQQRIVSIFDTFEASINNLEQQLAQREKQYEYYRNKLLTFEKEKN